MVDFKGSDQTGKSLHGFQQLLGSSRSHLAMYKNIVPQSNRHPDILQGFPIRIGPGFLGHLDHQQTGRIGPQINGG